MSTLLTRLPIAALVLALVPALAACSDDDDAAPEPAVHTADNGDVFNDVDADFATGLVQHHALALVLVDLTRGADVSPEVTALAEDILATESLEIETLTDWLAVWDVPAPETIRDHANAGHGDHGDHGDQGNTLSLDGEIPGGDLPGMPSTDELTELLSLRGDEFEQRWLELMITHHEGAIEIADQEIEDGTYSPAVDLAEAVREAQLAQVEQMKSLLEG
ncbi:DUF305 domain-containing protein [Nocardioides antri]|nr:DUF305 domain-containing protein [Nocardioides antri]